MSVLDKLASAVGRRDEAPNIELAKEIAVKADKKSVALLVENLSNKSKDIQNDCIKVLYEAGELKPALLVSYAAEFAALLNNKNNRLQWGAMTALHAISQVDAEVIFPFIKQIIAAANSGSVITKDQAVNILIRLCAINKFAAKAFPLLLEQLQNSPANQLPMYAERSMEIINEKNKTKFIAVLTKRLPDIEKDTKRKRVEKVISKLNK